jgi:two-component system response regulator HydG
MTKARLLIVHPDPSALTLLTSMLKSLGHEIDEAANDRVAVRLMERGGIDLMLAGVNSLDADALELLAYMRRKHRQVPVILLFSSPNPERAREALRLGALTVLRYPVPATELRAAVMQALAPLTLTTNGSGTPAATAAPAAGPPPTPVAPTGSVPAPHRGIRPEIQARDLGLIGSDPSLLQAIELAATMALSNTPMLIVGEPGTGRSLLARAIHTLSPRAEHAFTVLDANEFGETLSEPERIGTKPNGTGHGDGFSAWSTRLHQAQGGTLYLNDVAALPDVLQTKLLYALQGIPQENDGQVRPDIRFLMSSSENMLSLVEKGAFRQDLFYRISVICLKLPPLRHRSADIEPLADHFRERFAEEFGKHVVGFTHDALEVLAKHDWPGNIRELEGVIRRGVVLCQGTRITSGHLAPSLGHSRSSRTSAISPRSQTPASILPLKEALEEPEKRIIIQALQALNWNRQETARVLDINRTTLYKKMKKYGLLVDGPIWVN